MRGRFNGGYTGTQQTTNIGTAKGIYNMVEVQQYSGITQWPRPPEDLYFNYVIALFHGNGGASLSSASATSNLTPIHKDASTNNFLIAVNGDVRNDEFHPYQEGYYSNFFDGTGDYLTVASNTAFGFGTGDFTIECWVYPTVNARQDWVDITNGTQRALLYYSGSAITFYSVPPNAAAITGPAMTLNKWTHLAVSKQSGNTKLFVDGVQVGSTYTTNRDYGSTNSVTIGKDNVGSTHVTGYMSNLRIVKGTAVYTSAFTPSTTPLTAVANTSLLTCQSNRFIDNSTNNFTITRNGDVAVRYYQPFGLSAISTATFTNNQPSPGTNGYYGVYFDGTGDYLTVASNASFGFGTGDFTVEFWHYTTAKTQLYPSLVNNMATAAWGTNKWAFYDRHNDASTKFTFWVYNYNTTTPVITSTLAPQNNTWYHIALVRSGSTFSLYINGALDTTYTNSNSLDGGSSQPFGIGYSDAASTAYHGYISNLRVVKGTAVYTTTFTPSTTPLTSITNTSLLTCQSSTIIDNSTNNFAITTAGNAAVTVSHPFTSTVAGSAVVGYGSAYFDGTGDWLTLPTNSNLTLTGDFTIDLWVYPTVASASQTIWSPISPAADRSIQVDGTNTNWVYYDGTANRTIGSFVLNTWTNIVITRSGSTVRGFKDGVQGFSVTDSGTLEFSGQGIGYRTRATAGSNFNGYISNFRLIKGTAIYTANFIPPSMPVTAVTNTSLLTLQNNGPINNSGFEDSSPFDHIITRNGNVSQGSFSPYGSNWSNHFDGTGDYLTLPDSNNWDFGTGDFTIELWVKYNAITTSVNWIGSYTSASSGWSFRNTSDVTQFTWGDTVIFQQSDAKQINTWTHYAVSRQGSSLKVFKNGVQLGSTVTNTTDLSGSTGLLYIGTISVNLAGWALNGHLSNIRVVKGTALYTSDFSVPTAPLTAVANTVLLTCQSNRIIDTSASNATITRNGDVSVQRFSPFAPSSIYDAQTYGGSAYFDGTTDWLNFSGITVGTNAYTVEFWYYHTGTFAAAYGILGTANNNALNIRINNATTIAIDQQGVAQTTFTVPTMAASVWNHVVVVRNTNNVTTVFVNGVRSSTGTSTMSTNYSAASDYVGRIGTNYFPGYITDLRVVVGSAVYDPTQGTITVPTSPLTSVANTRLLLNMTNAGQYDNSMNSYWESFNNTQGSPSRSYFGSGSLYFDGTADYLSTRYTQGQWFLGTSFTIEAWVYIIARATSDFPIFSQEVAVTSSFAFQSLVVLADGALNFNVRPTTGGGITSVGGGTVPVGTWTHCAVSVDAGQARVFLNGTQVGSTTTVTMMAVNLPVFVGIGGFGNGYNTGVANSNHLNGYIDDLRVTRGIARYTANFTPPTNQFNDR